MDSGRPRPVPRLHLVTDDDILASTGFVDLATRLLRTGGSALALHVRGPRTGGGLLHALTSSLAAPAREAGAQLVVNDRVDVALCASVRAVHLGRRSLSAAEARRLLGPESWVGASTHTEDETAEAIRDGADWIFVGTVYATPSHSGRAACGPEGLKRAVGAAAGTPVLAIGGVTPDRAAELREVGAHGVAVVRGVWRAGDPAAAVRDYLEALTHGVRTTGSREGT